VSAGGLYSFGGWLKSGGINQPSEHWWEWTSDKDANTNNRPLLPWPESFTPHFTIPTNATSWVYANRTFIMPTGFPAIQLRHRYAVSAPASGSIYLDNAVFRPLPQPSVSSWSNLVAFGSAWSYSTNTPPQGWFKADFDDRAWARGAAKFGGGSGPRNISTRLAARKAAYYFRQQFVVNFDEAEELLLAATCTDNYAGKVYPLRIFLNGTEALTSGIEAVTGQGNDVRYYDLQPFAHLLKAGTNTIGIILQNTWATDFDDIAFDVNVKAIPYRGASAQLKLLATIPQVVLECATPAGTLWEVRSCDSLFSGPWRVLDVFTNTTAQIRFVADPAPAHASRFYQLVPY